MKRRKGDAKEAKRFRRWGRRVYPVMVEWRRQMRPWFTPTERRQMRRNNRSRLRLRLMEEYDLWTGTSRR